MIALYRRKEEKGMEGDGGCICPKCPMLDPPLLSTIEMSVLPCVTDYVYPTKYMFGG